MIDDVTNEEHDPYSPDAFRVRCPDCGKEELRKSEPGKERCNDCDRLMATSSITGDVEEEVYVTSRTNIYHDHQECFALKKANGHREVLLSKIKTHYDPCSYCDATAAE